MSDNNHFQRASVTGIDVENGNVLCNMLSGPIVTVPYVGIPPSIGDNVWLIEIVPGAFMCMGAPGRAINPSVSVFNSLAQTVINSTLTVIAFDTIEWNTDTPTPWQLTAGGSLFLQGTAAAPLLPAGLYHVIAQVQYAINGVGAREVRIEENQGGGTFVPRGMQTHQTPAATLGDVCNASVIALMSGAAKTITARTRQVSGGNLDTTAGAGHTFMQVTRLGSVLQPTS